MTRTTAVKRRTKKRKKKPPPEVMAEVLEFVENIQRLERQNIPIFPDHPKPH